MPVTVPQGLSIAKVLEESSNLGNGEVWFIRTSCLKELSNVRGSRSRQDLLDVRNGIKNGRVIGNILTLEEHEMKNLGFLP